jgi:hypothetical protein
MTHLFSKVLFEASLYLESELLTLRTNQTYEKGFDSLVCNRLIEKYIDEVALSAI